MTTSRKLFNPVTTEQYHQSNKIAYVSKHEDGENIQDIIMSGKRLSFTENMYKLMCSDYPFKLKA